MRSTYASQQAALAEPMTSTFVLQDELRWEMRVNSSCGQVTVTHNGIFIAFFSVVEHVVAGVEVRSDFQRRGIATTMHTMLAECLDFRHANTRTRAGNAWTKTLPNYKKAGRLIEKLWEPRLG